MIYYKCKIKLSTTKVVDLHGERRGGDRVKKCFQKLPDSELDVMLALWNGHPDMTRQEVEHFVNQKKQLAATTILSMLIRLEKKKFVSVKRDEKTNLYSPLISQEEYKEQEGKGFLEKLYGNSLKDFVASLYRGKQIGSRDIEELEEYLKELKKGGE